MSEQQGPPIVPAKTLSAWQVVADPDSGHVVVIVWTQQGQFVQFLEAAAPAGAASPAEAIGQQIIDAARQARSRLHVPPVSLVLPQNGQAGQEG